jgi:hypothetical protein
MKREEQKKQLGCVILLKYNVEMEDDNDEIGNMR